MTNRSNDELTNTMALEYECRLSFTECRTRVCTMVRCSRSHGMHCRAQRSGHRSYARPRSAHGGASTSLTNTNNETARIHASAVGCRGGAHAPLCPMDHVHSAKNPRKLHVCVRACLPVCVRGTPPTATHRPTDMHTLYVTVVVVQFRPSRMYGASPVDNKTFACRMRDVPPILGHTPWSTTRHVLSLHTHTHTCSDMTSALRKQVYTHTHMKTHGVNQYTQLHSTCMTPGYTYIHTYIHACMHHALPISPRFISCENNAVKAPRVGATHHCPTVVVWND